MDWKWPRQLELVQQVGEGWLGNIYLARDQDSPRQVYTRVLSDGALPSLAPLTALLLFQATAQHPHILPTTLPQVSGGDTFYSMQPAERGSLRTLVERDRASGQRPDPLTALDLIRQVGEALAYAHAQGVTHGNLKPENVLLQPGRALLGREGFHVLLSDFGLNTLRPPEGSPYLNPRQRRGEQEGAADDLYGLGALLFFALSGQDPPPGVSAEALSLLPLEQRPLVGRALGLLTPFGGVPDFLDALARQLPGPGTPPVTLRPEEGHLRLVPGEPCLTRVRLRTDVPLSAALLVEGLPPEWVSLPPAVQLQGGQEATLPLTFRVPRQAEARSGERELRLRLVRGQPGGAGPGELLAQQTLAAEIVPFHAGKLTLHAPPGKVGRRVRLGLELKNAGNQTRRYALQAQLPPGGTLLGPPPAPLTLAPGEQTRAALDVRLPPTLLRGRRREVGVVAQVVEEEGRALRAGITLRQRPALPAWGTAALLGALALAAWQAAHPPSIGAFTLEARSGESPTRGEPFTLSWDTAGARQVRIAELPGQALRPSGTLELPGLAGAKTYTLQARGWLRSVQRQVTVQPRPPAPGITALGVTPPAAGYGEPVTVRWEVRDAPEGQPLQLSPLGEVPARGQRTVPLTRDTTFTLTVPGGPAGQEQHASATATLRPPAITRLTVTPGQVRRGENVTVQWQVSGARQVRLGGLGTLPAQGSRTLPVPADARAPVRYVLKASNGQTEVTATAEVQLALPRPTITAFRAVPQDPAPGQPVRVFWRTTGAEGVELRWGNERQRLPPEGQFTLTATPELRVLGLVAQAEGGVPAARSLTLAPQAPAPVSTPLAGQTPPPEPENQPVPAKAGESGPRSRAGGSQPAQRGAPVVVRDFRAVPAQLQPGQATTLVWRVAGTGKVFVAGLRGPNPDGSFPPAYAVLTPRLGRNTTYTLWAGDVQRTFQVTVGGDAAAPQRQPGLPSSGEGAARSPASSPYRALAGTWAHSLGQLTLQISGNRVTGTLLSTGGSLPSGTLRGSLLGPPDAASFNGYLSAGDRQVAVVLRFTGAGAFQGVYAGEQRQPWCGWRGTAPGRC